MYVRKFESDTVEDALKQIKRELGPDAVILKTVTNKGIKGAFKKNKIEITAAISEKNYVKKASVDQVLDNNQKDEFYNGSASYIANMIDQHEESKEKMRENKTQNQAQSKNSYGSIGLNRTVSTTKNISNTIKNGLDDFLSLGEREEKNNHDFDFDREIKKTRPVREEAPIRKKATAPVSQAMSPEILENNYEHRAIKSAALENDNKHYEKQKNKIDELEKKLFELTKNVERIHKREPLGVYQLRTTLRSLGINEIYIQELIKKGLFELNENDVENADIVFEFALREMMNTVVTDMPLFSRTDSSNTPVLTVFVSETTCGQSAMVQKISSLKKDSVIVRNSNIISTGSKSHFTEKIFDLNIVKTSTISEMVSECRKAMENGKSVFIDYKCSEAGNSETKKFIDGLRRAFPKVEVLITLSAIHSELYNRKVLATYRKLSDGLVVSNLDACLNFGSLFNINWEMKDLPFKFFGTGEVVPDDLEAASSERLMSGIFKLS
jgi:flagellar biosynthesis protein FlhF